MAEKPTLCFLALLFYTLPFLSPDFSFSHPLNTASSYSMDSALFVIPGWLCNGIESTSNCIHWVSIDPQSSSNLNYPFLTPATLHEAVFPFLSIKGNNCFEFAFCKRCRTTAHIVPHADCNQDRVTKYTLFIPANDLVANRDGKLFLQHVVCKMHVLCRTY